MGVAVPCGRTRLLGVDHCSQLGLAVFPVLDIKPVVNHTQLIVGGRHAQCCSWWTKPEQK